MKKYWPYMLVFVLVLFVSTCQKQQKTEESSPGVTVSQEKIDLEKALVSSPASLLSARDELRFQFKEPLVPGHFVGHVLDKNPFSFEPGVKGDAIWRSASVLVFKPVGNLPAGKTVKGVLNGKIALGEQKNVNDLDFSFKVAEQEVISFTGDFNPVSGKRNVARFSGQIEFSQPVNIEKLRRDLVLKGPEGKLDLTTSPNTLGTVINIESGEVNREGKGKSYRLTLPKSYTADNQNWETHIPLPGINEFKVIAHMDMTETNADGYTYGFRFNEPVKSGMDISGFVSISPDINFTLKTEGRYLMVTGPFMPGKQYHMHITKGFPSEYENQLQGDYDQVFSLDNIKPEVQWLSEGVYLPTSNEYKLQFKSVNVAKVKLHVFEIFPQNIGFFVQENMLRETGNDNNNYYYGDTFRDLDRVAKEIYNKELDLTTEKNKWINTELDLSPTFKGKKNSVFVVSVRFDQDDLTGKPVSSRDNLSEGDLYFANDDYYNHPARPGYYYSHGNTSKLLISSDIGLTVKKAGDGLHVFALNVVTARPAAGLDLKLFGYQNQVLESGRTDGDGYLHFNSRESRGYIYGKDESGMALVRINHPAWEMNSFDVGGQEGARNGVDAFIYTERGVHRPGDTVHLAAIIRFDRGIPPKDQPVILTVNDPRGNKVLEKKESCGSNGHVYFQIPTNPEDPTGNWTAALEIAKQKFVQVLKIEAVKPNRLKIYADIPAILQHPGDVLTGNITSTYLFGAPAAGLKVAVDAILMHKDIDSEKYSDYTFTTPLVRFDEQYRDVFKGSLDENGVCNLNFTFDDLHNANGLVRVALHTRVYEKGGSFTENYKNTVLDPFGAYAGIKDIFNWNSVRFGESVEIPIIDVDAKGNPLSGRKLRVECFVNQKYWWWHYDEYDRQSYMNSKNTFRISSNDYVSGAEPVKHAMTFEDYGSHYIQVTDLESGHRAGYFVYCSRWGGRADVAEADERNVLQIRSDKNVYNVGDRAKLSFETPNQGTAVLTLEQGDNILHREWKNVTGTTTTFDVNLDPQMVPNVYAVIYVVQPRNDRNNDLPTRLYGVKTLNVEDQDTRLPLSMIVPDKLEPKQDFTVKVRSQASKPSTFTLAVVDEGLLDLTGFETPSPWDYFFQKIRLAVQTLDNFDDIIGMLFPDMDKYFTIGGGMMEEGRLKRLDRSQVQRFVPVVLYQEPMTINPGKEVDVKFTMPNYVGSVRIMLVAASGNSYVSKEETVPVKQPLMVLPDIPRVARPGDVFDLPVTVFAMEEAVKDVSVELQLSSNLHADTSRASLKFSKIGDQNITFKVKVGNRIGGDTLTVLANSGSYHADYTVNLPISSANPFYTEVKDTVIVDGESVTFVPEAFGLTGTNAARLVFSRLPNIDFDERLRYLIRYPYGCLEQTTSSVFPQLFLNELIETKDYQKQVITENINAAIKKYASFQLRDGFSYWPNSSFYRYEYNDWCTSYVGHFLTLAKSKGYYVPDDLYNHWLSFSRRYAKQINVKNHRYQAYRLFTLALAGAPEMGAMNLVRENYLDKLDPLSRKLLAASYYLAGQKDAALQVDQTNIKVESYRELSGTYGSGLRDRAMIAYLCLLMDDIKDATLIMTNIAREFNSSSWYSTQETAMVMLAASTLYAKVPGTGDSPQFRVEIPGQKDQKIELDRTQQVLELEGAWGKPVKISSGNHDPLYVALQVEGVPIEDRVQTVDHGISMSRSFFNDEGYPMGVNQVKQGESFWVQYTITNDFELHLEELALTSIFPAGWEILNQRLTGEDLPAWVRKANPSSGEYMDIRDDRVNWFFDLPSRRKITFMAHINPTFKGEYKLPPVSVEAMYSPEYYARLAGFTTVIK